MRRASTMRAMNRLASYSTMIAANMSSMVMGDASGVTTAHSTMLLMFAAIIVLYEASLFMARIVLARRIKKQNAELALEEAE